MKKFHINPICSISFEKNHELLKTAEISYKYAKKLSKNFLIYSKDLYIEKEFENNIFWSEKIRKALLENRIIVYYQPILNNLNNLIEKYECLVRLIDEDGTIHSPINFLSISKKSKQYLEITKKVIDKSFEKFKNSNFYFSINFTVEDILDNELNNYLITKIQEYKIGNRLIIEIVESEKITDYDPIYEFIKKIKLYKCKIAIDDFGSGYSNFDYLINVHTDFVKIDGSIIKKINTDDNALEIVRLIVKFSKKMGFKTVAEFISDSTLLKIAKELEIDYSQGFFIGKPFEDLINTSFKI